MLFLGRFFYNNPATYSVVLLQFTKNNKLWILLWKDRMQR